MRFERLHLPAFGPFTNLDLDFPSADHDLHLVYGPNEAGKSSLLRAISDMLYGIHVQSPDNFLHDYKILRLGGAIRNRDAKSLAFLRRKGNKDTLLDPDGQIIAASALEPFIGHVDRAYFESMFGLSTTGLRSGAEQLLKGQGRMGEALFSASLAGTPVHQVLDALDQEACRIFNGNTKKDVTLRPALDDLEAAIKASKDAQVRPEVWEEALRQHGEAEDQRVAIRDQLTADRARKEWLERCMYALPHLSKLRAKDEALVALKDVEHLPDGILEHAKAIMDHFTNRTEELEKLNASITKAQAKVKEHIPDASVLSVESEIQAVHVGLALYRSQKASVDGLSTEILGSGTSLAAGMRSLGLTGELSTVESQRILVADAATLRTTAHNLRKTEELLAQNTKDIATAQKEKTAAIGKIRNLGETQVSSLRKALASSAPAESTASGLRAEETSLASLLRQVATSHAHLAGLPTTHEAAFNLSPPTLAAIRKHQCQLEELDRRKKSTEDVINKTRKSLSDHNRELTKLDRQGKLPSLEALLTSRKTRDELWQLIADSWIKKKPIDKGKVDSLGESFPQSINRADDLADQLREHADGVAKAEQVRELIETELEVQTEETKILGQVAQDRAAWSKAWGKLWQTYGIVPDSPEEMEEWRTAFDSFCQKFEKWQDANERVQASRLMVSQAEVNLRKELKAGNDTGLSELVKEARQLVGKADEAKGTRAILEERIVELEKKITELDSEVPALKKQIKDAEGIWTKTCGTIGLDTSIETEVAIDVVDKRIALVDLFDKHAEQLAKREDLRRVVGEFEGEVERLSDLLNVPIGSVEVRENKLSLLIKEATARRERHDTASADLGEKVDEGNQVRTLLEAVTQSLTDLQRDLNASDVPGIQVVLGRLRQRLELEKERATLNGLLDDLARGQDLVTFTERVRGEEPETLQTDIAGLTESLQALDGRMEDAVKMVKQCEDGKHELEKKGTVAADELQRAKYLTSRVREQATHYVRVQLAAHLLRDQIERFRQENQAPLLKRASACFNLITMGAFENLGTGFQPDDTPVLVGRRNGKDVAIEGMSEGTRDQLYLALRLAAIEKHIEEHEPMPLILDDLLMSFDDDRARAVIPVLADLSKRTQVLLFTHHEHVVRLCSEVLGESGFHRHTLSPSMVQVVAYSMS